jgi:hypothetical protein
MVKVIHSTHGRTKSREDKKSRGTRLSMKILQEAFKRTEAKKTAITLKTVPSEASQRGLYLTFPQNSSRGFVQSGKNMKGTCMEFDVVPADTTLAEPCYAFSLHRKREDPALQHNWLIWDWQTDSVRLTDHIQPSCFVWIPDGKSSNWKMFHLVVHRPEHEVKMNVQMGAAMPSLDNIGIPLMSDNLSYIKQCEDLREVWYLD